MKINYRKIRRQEQTKNIMKRSFCIVTSLTETRNKTSNEKKKIEEIVDDEECDEIDEV